MAAPERPIYFFNPSYNVPNEDYFNMGLLCVASHLRREGHAVEVYLDYTDAGFTASCDYDKVLPDLLSRNPVYIGISAMTAQLPSGIDLTRRIKKLSPKTPVIWGGAHANVLADHLLRTCKLADAAIEGPGELAGLALWDHYVGKKAPLESIPGLVFRKNGELVKNRRGTTPQSVYNQPLDYSVVVNFHPLERLFAGEPVREAPVFNTIGCPYKCTFCINAVDFRRLIFRDIDVVIDEIKQVMRYGANHIFFIDELFFTVYRRVDRFLERLEEEGLKFTWFAHARVDCIGPGRLTYEKLVRIRERGCREFHIGIESGSQQMLDRMAKQMNVSDVVPALDLIVKAGIMPKVNFIFGMPGETLDDMRRTIYLVMELAERYQGKIIFCIFFFYPIPGSPMTDESFMSVDLTEDQKLEYMLESAKISGDPYLIFSHFEKSGFYSWIRDKKRCSEYWSIARRVAEICQPYNFRSQAKQEKLHELRHRRRQSILKHGSNVIGKVISEETCRDLIDNCPPEHDKELVKRWLELARNYRSNWLDAGIENATDPAGLRLAVV
ncbi:MAG: B12-binding domain-containing radical SAM protein [Planctomycetes bacterium]|nr:B12-binding domain-containing radical SAM protein [Planctomycetota bacterium]